VRGVKHDPAQSSRGEIWILILEVLWGLICAERRVTAGECVERPALRRVCRCHKLDVHAQVHIAPIESFIEKGGGPPPMKSHMEMVGLLWRCSPDAQKHPKIDGTLVCKEIEA